MMDDMGFLFVTWRLLTLEEESLHREPRLGRKCLSGHGRAALAFVSNTFKPCLVAGACTPTPVTATAARRVNPHQ